MEGDSQALTPETVTYQVSLFPIAKLSVHPMNVRKTRPSEEVENLMNNIATNWGKGIYGTGLNIPVEVTSSGMVYIGQRRTEAFLRLLKETGDQRYSQIPAVVREDVSDFDALKKSFIDTVHSVDTDVRDKVKAWDQLMDELVKQYPDKTEGELQKEGIKIISISLSRLNTWLAHRNYPKVIEGLFQEGLLTNNETDTLNRVWKRCKELQDHEVTKDFKDFLVKIAKTIRTHTLDEMAVSRELKLKDLKEIMEPASPTKGTTVLSSTVGRQVSQPKVEAHPKESEVAPRMKITRQGTVVEPVEVPAEDLSRKEKALAEKEEEWHFMSPIWVKDKVTALVAQFYHGMTLPVYFRRLTLKIAEDGVLPKVD